MCTSCINNDGVVCVTDFIAFLRSFRFVMHHNLINLDDGPRPKYWSNTMVSFIAIEGRVWTEAKKDV